MTIDESLKLITKTFSFLIEEYGFSIVYTKEFRPDHYSIGLESSVCRILFYRELGGWNMFIGTLAAPFDNEIDDWVLLENLMFYLGKEIDRSSLEGKSYQEQIVASLALMAKAFKPLCKQIVEMFRAPQIVAQWKPSYQKLIHEEAQRRYGTKSKRSPRWRARN